MEDEGAQDAKAVMVQKMQIDNFDHLRDSAEYAKFEEISLRSSVHSKRWDYELVLHPEEPKLIADAKEKGDEERKKEKACAR